MVPLDALPRHVVDLVAELAVLDPLLGMGALFPDLGTCLSLSNAKPVPLDQKWLYEYCPEDVADEVRFPVEPDGLQISKLDSQMLFRIIGTLLILCCVLTGCTAPDGNGPGVVQPSPGTAGNRSSVPDFSFDHPEELEKQVLGLEQERWNRVLTRTPPGTKLTIIDNQNRSFTGTLARADAGGVELTHCGRVERVIDPDGQKRLKTFLVPHQFIKASSVSIVVFM